MTRVGSFACCLMAACTVGSLVVVACGDDKRVANLSSPGSSGEPSGTGQGPGAALEGGGSDGAPPSDGGIPVDSPVATGEAPEGVYVCPTTVAWVESPTAVAGLVQAPSITFSADELTAVWVLPSGGQANVHFADRADRSAAFGAGQKISAALGPFETDRAAVSDDGLSIILVRAGRKRLGAITRPSRGGAFADDAKLVADLNGDLGGLEEAGVGDQDHAFHSPALATGAQILLYVDLGPTTGHAVYHAPRDPMSGFKYTGMIDEAILHSAPGTGKLRLPTGLSSDQRTIFYVDEVTGTEKVAWRPSRFKEFGAPLDLGARTQASPNATCKRLYHVKGTGVGFSDAP